MIEFEEPVLVTSEGSPVYHSDPTCPHVTSAHIETTTVPNRSYECKICSGSAQKTKQYHNLLIDAEPSDLGQRKTDPEHGSRSRTN